MACMRLYPRHFSRFCVNWPERQTRPDAKASDKRENEQGSIPLIHRLSGGGMHAAIGCLPPSQIKANRLWSSLPFGELPFAQHGTRGLLTPPNPSDSVIEWLSGRSRLGPARGPSGGFTRAATIQ